MPGQVGRSPLHHEVERLIKELTNRGYYAHNVQGDGNCFFRATAIALEGRQSGHSLLRQEAIFLKVV